MKHPAERGILVVDDDRRFQEFVARVAGRLGVGCVHAHSGEEALRILGTQAFRLVILDGLLPGIRGEDVVRKIRERFGPEELPILFCSAFYRDIRSYRFLMNECRVNQVLHKPVDEERFLEVLEKLFGAEGRETLPPEPEERAELRASYVASAIERVESMRRTLQVLAEQDAPDLVSALRLEAHRFRGSGASFDLPEVSRLGGAIEDLLTSRPKEGGLPGAFRSRLEGLLDALESALRREAGQSPIAELRGFSPRPRILLVDDPESALARQVNQLQADGQPIWVVARGEALRKVVELQTDAVFVAADGEDGLDGAIPICATLRVVTSAAIILMAREAGVRSRLNALEAGARAVVPRPTEPEALFRFAALFGKEIVRRPVLLLGRKGDFLGDVAEKIGYLGRAAVPCTDPERIFFALEDHAPSLLLVDADPDWEESLAVVRMIRGDLRHLDLPIVLASERTHREWIGEAIASGATACIAKPISLIDLEPLLSSWAVQGGWRTKELSGLDVTTGLMGRERFERVLQRSVGLAKRQGIVLSVLGFETGLAGVRRRHGGLRGEEIAAAFAHHLATSLRTTDIVARWGPDRFLALLSDARAEDARRIAQERLDWLVKHMGTLAQEARPAFATVTFPDLRVGASALLEQIARTLDEALPREYWEEDFVVEVDR